MPAQETEYAVLRYNGDKISTTQLDPIEDSVNWLSSLRSRSYLEDVIAEVHGISDKREIVAIYKEVSNHSTIALELLNQAYSGPPRVSFLPLYYCVLNLSKISIILSGRRAALSKQRRHGASYPMTRNRHQLLTDEITVHPEGAFPLFYATLTMSPFPFRRPHSLSLSTVYPLISNVTYELMELKCPPARQELRFYLVQQGPGKYYFLVRAGFGFKNKNANSLRHISALQSGYRTVKGKPGHFRSPTVSASDTNDAYKKLVKTINRPLLNESYAHGSVRYLVQSPLCASRLKMPEELPIWLAYYHLSNVVRYKPTFLSKLEDTEAWPLILTIRKQAMLRYLLLFWSHVHKKSTFVATA